MKFAVIGTVILSALSTTAFAQQAINGGGQMFLLSGKCSKLTIGKKSYADCAPGVISTMYPNRRVGFHFSTQAGFGASFSGMDGENPTDNSDISHIDKVIINEKGGDPKTFEATGKCLYENPYAGVPAKVACSGSLDDGRKFSALFMSDGSKPK